MARISITVDYSIYNGTGLKFRAPCDSAAAEGLLVKYPGGSKTFIFKDANGQTLSGTEELFKEGVLLDVMLDLTNGAAFIKNAVTNSYIEQIKNGFFIVGAAEPESGPVLWFDTSGAAAGTEAVKLELSGDGASGVSVLIDDNSYPIENASLNSSPESGKYDFNIL